MNKNAIITVLVVVVIFGLGYYFFNKNRDVAYNSPTIVVNENTPSPSSTIVNKTPDAPIVTTSQNVSVSSSTAALTGTVSPNGGATTYWFEYGDSTALGSRSNAQALGSGYYSTPTPGFITGLRANTLYYYRLSAKNGYGTVNGSTYSFQTNNTAPPQGKAPTARTNAATSISRTDATINGQVNPNGSATNYWFEYGKNNDFGSVSQFQATNSGVTFMSVAATLSGLEPLTKYYFRLNTQNQYGVTNGAVMSFTTVGSAAASSPAVETLGAKNISSTDATFTGSINPNGADTTYWFEYSTSALLSDLIGSGTPRGTVTGTGAQDVQINVNGLQANTKYYYHLVGTNSHGTVTGKTVSFTTKR